MKNLLKGILVLVAIILAVVVGPAVVVCVGGCMFIGLIVIMGLNYFGIIKGPGELTTPFWILTFVIGFIISFIVYGVIGV